MKLNNKIYCLGDNIGFVEVISHTTGDLPLSVVNAARISYNKTKEDFDAKDQKLVEFLWANSHTSPFRHYSITLHLKAPLVVFRQITKYQVASTWREYEVDGMSVSLEVFDMFYDTDKGCSWNEVSGRYTELKPEFYIPDKMRANPAHGNKQSSFELPENFNHEFYSKAIKDECDNSYRSYLWMLDHGIAKEIARMVLPQNIYSESYWTVSLQALLHFFDQRMKKDAQYEIRQFSHAIYDLLEDDLTKLGFTREKFQ